MYYMINHKRRKSLSFADFTSQNFRPFITAQHLQLLKSSPQESSSFPFQKEKKYIGAQPINMELNSFKRKLSNYLQEHQNCRNLSQKKDSHLKGDEGDNYKSAQSSKMQASHVKQVYFNKLSNNIISRKSIRECLKGWASCKQKQKNQEKYSDQNLYVPKQETGEKKDISKSVLIVKQSDKHKKKLILTKKQQFESEFCNPKQVPIHHTQLFFYRKKKCKTQNIPDKQPPFENQNKKNNITIQEVLKMRSHIRQNFIKMTSSQKHQHKQQSDKNILISRQKEEAKQEIKSQIKQEIKFYRKCKKQKEVQVVHNETEVIQISPWQRHRQNTNDFQSFL